MKLASILGIVVPKLFKSLQASNDGWNASFNWVSLDEARQSGRPTMVIVYKPECPMCRKLKTKLTSHDGIRRLSSNFAMVHLRPDQLPEGDDTQSDVFEPDGRYVPRILFFDAKFNFLPEVRGALPQYQYFYGQANNVEASMTRALHLSKH